MRDTRLSRMVVLFCLKSLFLICLFLTFSIAAFVPTAAAAVHTYYVAADEVEWNYAPLGLDKMMGMPFMGHAIIYTEHGEHRIGTTYRKAIYREYTDDTFSKLKPRAPEWEHLGLVGPVLRGEVSDTIKVVFKNNGSRPYSMHPHGVFYAKESEGAGYADGATFAAKNGVAPGETHTYVWEVPERAGPGPNDPSSIVWLYHSHANEPKDVESGLIGVILISRKGAAGPSGRPKDVDRGFVSFFMMFDENTSWYLDHNIETYTTDPKGVKKGDFSPVDAEGVFLPAGAGFVGSNFKATINGYLFANMPLMTMKKGERVRWYVVTLGEGVNFHTPHWHGNVVTQAGQRTDVIPLSPAQMATVDMVPDNPGTWMLHCHLDEHMEMGMMALYKVEP